MMKQDIRCPWCDATIELEVPPAADTVVCPHCSQECDWWCDRWDDDEISELFYLTKKECQHPRSQTMYTGDGSAVDFCPDCGRNEAMGMRFAEDEGEE